MNLPRNRLLNIDVAGESDTRWTFKKAIGADSMEAAQD